MRRLFWRAMGVAIGRPRVRKLSRRAAEKMTPAASRRRSADACATCRGSATAADAAPPTACRAELRAGAGARGLGRGCAPAARQRGDPRCALPPADGEAADAPPTQQPTRGEH